MCPGQLLVTLLSSGNVKEVLNPKKLADNDFRTLKRTVRNNHQSGLSTIAEEFRRSSGTEVLGIGFHGRAAPQKLLITRIVINSSIVINQSLSLGVV